jgi:hypothetical protein
MALDERVKTRLIFLGFFIVLIGLSILMIKFGEGEWNDPECEGYWDLFGLSDCEYEQTRTEESLQNFGGFFGVVGVCGFFITVLMLLSASIQLIFGRASDDELAELEDELDSLENILDD